MIGYVTVGVDDLQAAEAFYSAFLPHLGYQLEISEEGLSYSIPTPQGKASDAPDFYVKPPHTGESASNGNGTMVAFQTPSQQMVRELHSAALAAGGRSEGDPGFRGELSDAPQTRNTLPMQDRRRDERTHRKSGDPDRHARVP